MTYHPKAALDMEVVHDAASRLLKTELHDLTLRFEETGYSGRVYQLVATDASGRKSELLLKGVEDATEYRFYKDVLEPLGLSSPVMYGLIGTEEDPYLFMEYIPHEPPDWEDLQRYEQAIDWLAGKDLVCEQHLSRIAELDYLEPFDIGPSMARLPAIARATQERLDPCFSEDLVALLERNRRRLEETAAWIHRGPQTVTHNDFQMLNILFGKGREQGRLYVVDWTYPAMGTVCIDLATLLHVAPTTYRDRLIARYRDQRPVQDFDSIYTAARVHVNLAILEWMGDAIRTGQGHTVERAKLQEAVEQLFDYFSVETPVPW